MSQAGWRAVRQKSIAVGGGPHARKAASYSASRHGTERRVTCKAAIGATTVKFYACGSDHERSELRECAVLARCQAACGAPGLASSNAAEMSRMLTTPARLKSSITGRCRI